MHRRNREINIFSISALDLFASAMGAFILIAIILFPYYMKNSDVATITPQIRQELKQLREENKRRQAETAAQQTEMKRLQATAQQQEQAIKQLRKQLRGTFLVIVLRWETNRHDVDLHVINPEGQEFFYEKHNRNGAQFPGVDAFLTVDSRRGPGIEVWLDPLASAGRYQLLVNLYERHGGARTAPVSGKVYFRDGHIDLPEMTLSDLNKKVEFAELEVDAQGNVTNR